MSRRILVTNDDGIAAPGLHSLVEALRPLGEVTVVAPAEERSAIGHAVSLGEPLVVEPAEVAGCPAYRCSGTPTDCVMVGVHELCRGRPDVVVSGINAGGNLGEDLTYSGTVSAAMEATIMGIPAMAVSALPPPRSKGEFALAAEVSAALCRFIMDRGLPQGVLLNVNVPTVPRDRLQGAAITRLGLRKYNLNITRKPAEGDKFILYIGGEPEDDDPDHTTDVHCVRNGKISITPVRLDLTASAAAHALEEMGLLEALRF